MSLRESGDIRTGFLCNCLTGDPVFGEFSLYAHLVEDSETVLFVTDSIFRLVYVNPSGRKLLASENPPADGLRIWDLFPPSEAPVVRRIAEEVLEQEGSSTTDYQGTVRSSDGTTHSVLVDLKPLRNRAAKAVGLQGSLRDVSVLSQAVQESDEQKERWLSALRSVGVGLVVVDRNREVFFQNEIVQSRFARKGDKRCYALYGRSEPCEDCVLEQVLAGKELATTLVRGQDKLSEESSVEILSSPVRDKAGEIVGALEVVVDITEKNRLAERLNILAKVVENMQEGVVIATFEGRILYTNDSFSQQTQRSRSELQQARLPELFVPPQDAEASGEAWMQRLALGVSGEYECRRKDNGNLPVLLNTFQIMDGQNRPSSVVGVCLDLTERKRLEADLIQSSKLAALGELISGITHELNNPLGAIMGYSQLMLKRLEKGGGMQLPEKFVRNLQSVSSEAERASKIIKNLLTFARRRQPDKAPVDINEVIESTFDLRSYDLQVNDVHVELQLGQRLPLILADFNQLQQVFLNLINNAVQAMLDKGGERVIAVQTRQERNRLEIRFSDRGPGIPAENIYKIFDPFFTTKEVGRGTGLGLSICLGIVKEHGGTIQVQSPPGAGTTFVIGLPVGTVEGGAVPSAEVECPEAVQQRRHTVLVVDDEMHMRRILEDYLEGQGLKVVSVVNGSAALQCLAQEKVDLIITDVKMPRMDGREFYAAVQERHPELAERVIFLTGDFLNEETAAFIESTGNQGLAKPVSLAKLWAQVTQVLQRE